MGLISNEIRKSKNVILQWLLFFNLNYSFSLNSLQRNKSVLTYLGRSASVSCDLGVIKTEVKPRSRPEVRKIPGQPPVHIPLPPPPPPHLLEKRYL